MNFSNQQKLNFNNCYSTLQSFIFLEEDYRSFGREASNLLAGKLGKGRPWTL